jgi:hypothetical protein
MQEVSGREKKKRRFIFLERTGEAKKAHALDEGTEARALTVVPLFLFFFSLSLSLSLSACLRASKGTCVLLLAVAAVDLDAVACEGGRK